MSVVSEARDALEAALQTVEGMRTYRDLGAAVDPPGVFVGPPSLTWETVCPSPTGARFLVYVVVSADERALDNLWSWIELVTDAIEEVDRAVVIRADPGTFNSSGIDLPSYEIQIEVSL